MIMKRQLLYILLYLSSCVAFAQDIIISGKVTESSDGVTGIPFVNVVVKGTTIGTTTDFDGNYKLKVPPTADTLRFSFIGYLTVQEPISGRSVIDVQMGADAKTLEEIVVVGYGAIKKSELTSSISSLRGDVVARTPNQSFESALQGRSAGVMIQNTSGRLGEGINIRIRGASSLSASNQPLYVIDDIPINSSSSAISGNSAINPISAINPNDIESIQILKDAGATAIYGSRAANGVILITTKKGISGKPKVNLDYQYGISSTPKKLDMFNAQEYKRLQVEHVLRNLANNPFIDISDLTDRMSLDLLDSIVDAGQFPYFNFALLKDTVQGLPLAIADNNLNTDWQDEVFRTGTSHQANISISGGSKKVDYYGSIGYSDQKGILIGNDFKKLNGKINSIFNINDQLKITVGVTQSLSKSGRLNEDADLGSPLQALSLPPADAYNPETKNLTFFTIEETYYNPLKELAFSTNETDLNRTIVNLSLDYSLSDNLSLRGDWGFDHTNQEDLKIQGKETLSGRPDGEKRTFNTRISNQTSNLYLTYSGQLSDNISSNLTAGVNYQVSNTNFDAETRIGNQVLNPNLLADAFKFSSSFFRAHSTFKDKYLIQLAGRLDGSSKFGEENRYGFFPSASVGWNLHNEPFLNGTLINTLKLKGSYGVIGNTPTESFLNFAIWEEAYYGQEVGSRPSNLSNPNIQWENTAQLDIGLELNLWENRINTNVNFYQKNTSSLLFARPLSGVTGFSNVLDNIGEIQNSGLELSLGLVIADNEKLEWNTDFNITFARNDVKKLNSPLIRAGVNATREGDPLGFFYLRKFVGVDEETGKELYETKSGGTTDDYFDENILIDNMGDPNPDYFGGVSNRISWKNIDFSFLVQFFQGHQVYNQTGEEISNSGSPFLLNQTRDQNERWMKPGDVTNVPALNPNQTQVLSSTRWLEEGSFTRLKNASIGYNFPEAICESLRVSSLKLYLSGQNLLTFTDYSGFDPEVNTIDSRNSSVEGNLITGVDYYSTPIPRTYLIGFKAGF